MIPIVPFVGKSNSGKATLLENVVREIKLKGYHFIGKEGFSHDVQHG